MRRPMRLLNGHLGSSVSALVDGQLDQESTERAWAHVQTCPACRREVEREGWVKRQLAQVAGGPAHAGGPGAPEAPSERLMGSLLHLDPAAVAWAQTREIEDRGRGRRRAGIAVVGAGSVSAAVIGLVALGGLPGTGGSGGPAASLGSRTAVPTRTVVAPGSRGQGRLPGWTVSWTDAGVARARAVGARR